MSAIADPVRFAADHAAYVAALEAAGMAVTLLDPLPGFPDAMFVEDTAICLPEAAILMRPGAESRAGEVASMAPALAAQYGEAVIALEAPARVEGGDILIAPKEVIIGLSARTDRAGVDALRTVLDRLGHRLRVVETPPGVLHFKTDCSLVDDDTGAGHGSACGLGLFCRLPRDPGGRGRRAGCQCDPRQ